jgi:hypothetical protein
MGNMMMMMMGVCVCGCAAHGGRRRSRPPAGADAQQAAVSGALCGDLHIVGGAVAVSLLLLAGDTSYVQQAWIWVGLVLVAVA